MAEKSVDRIVVVRLMLSGTTIAWTDELNIEAATNVERPKTLMFELPNLIVKKGNNFCAQVMWLTSLLPVDVEKADVYPEGRKSLVMLVELRETTRKSSNYSKSTSRTAVDEKNSKRSM